MHNLPRPTPGSRKETSLTTLVVEPVLGRSWNQSEQSRRYTEQRILRIKCLFIHKSQFFT